MADFHLSEDELADIRETFEQWDLDKNGHITTTEIGNVMKALGEDIPGYKLRDIVKEVDKNKNGMVEFDEFLEIYKKNSKKFSAGSEFKKLIKKKEQIESSGGTSESSAEGTKHSYSDAERVAFADWINTALQDDQEAKAYLPIDPATQDIFTKIQDGIILCKMINLSVPDTVDERAINKPKSGKLSIYKIHENMTLALNSASSIGCNIVNIGAEDLEKGKPHLVLGVLWQIIRIGLFANITLTNVPGLARLLREGETLNDLMALSPEDILLRWFNYHLEQAGHHRRVKNFSEDIKDSECYSVLLNQISPPELFVDSRPMQEKDLTKRAERMLQMADRIGCRKFVRPKDVVAGNSKLNMAFVANLFNCHPALPPMDVEETEELEEPREETREEKTFRNWMNSIGVNPYVNNLYRDLCNGLVLLQLYDIVKPGSVNWDRVNRPPFKQMGGKMKKIENCNYAVEVGKTMKFSLVGIGGQDIHDCNETLTLAVVWQQMRSYTLALLSKLTPDGRKIEDKDIIEWVNEKYDVDGSGFITDKEIRNVLKNLGKDMPGYKIRQIIDGADTNENGKVDFDEFLKLFNEHTSQNSALSEFTQLIKKEHLEISGGTSESSAEGTKHSFSEGERIAFVEWIKTALKNDEEFKTYLPIDPASQEIFTKIKDGIILCKMINVAVPETVDERAITRPKSKRDLTAVRENLTLALNSARSIGCNIVNIGAEDLEKGTPHLVLGVLWQIIRLGLFVNITIYDVPEMVALLSDDETPTLNDLMALSPEEILLKWFNYHLERSGSSRRVQNFSDDIRDSEGYFWLLRALLKHIAPDDVDSTVTEEKDLTKRAARMLEMANRIGCRKFVRPKDVVAGDPKLNMAFVANLFNHHHCLPALKDADSSHHSTGHENEEHREETREERTFRNWMNSIGVSPYVNNLYRDLRNGVVLLDVFDIIEPGIVKKKVNRPPYKQKRERMEKLENCNCVVEIGKGKEMNFSLVGIGGQDICDGKENLILSIVWQQMRAYTLNLLSKLTADGSKMEESDIIKWVNEKLQAANKTSYIRNFEDPSISSSLPVLDLVDAIKPGTVKYDMVSKGTRTEDKHKNAVYALSVARKIGAATYALPDDLVEVKRKMVMTVFACLKVADLEVGKKSKKKR